MTSHADWESLHYSISKLKCSDDAPNEAVPISGQVNHSSQTIQRPKQQCFDSFLCLDFESTCINADDPTLQNPLGIEKHQLRWLYPNEIIEWPVVLLQWRISTHGDRWELFEVDRYRRFVRPVWRPLLSKFCMELTGISQEDVDQAKPLSQVMKDFDENFVKPHKLFTPQNRTVWVTDGPWDFRDHFVKSTYLAGIHINSLPRYLRSPISFIDLRHLLKVFIPDICPFPIPPSLSLVDTMSAFGLEFQGNLHSGIDDAYNLSRLLCEMVKFSTQNPTSDPRWKLRVNKQVTLNPRRFFWTSKNFRCTWTLP